VSLQAIAAVAVPRHGRLTPPEMMIVQEMCRLVRSASKADALHWYGGKRAMDALARLFDDHEPEQRRRRLSRVLASLHDKGVIHAAPDGAGFYLVPVDSTPEPSRRRAASLQEVAR